MTPTKPPREIPSDPTMCGYPGCMMDHDYSHDPLVHRAPTPFCHDFVPPAPEKAEAGTSFTAFDNGFRAGRLAGIEEAAKIAENHSPLGTGLQTRNGIAAAIRAFLARAGEGKP